MGAYFAMRIKKKYDSEGLQTAQSYYNEMFAIQLYQQFQVETNSILTADGYEDIIPA